MSEKTLESRSTSGGPEKAPESRHHLPDDTSASHPLRQHDGLLMTSAEEWQRTRAPELRELFQTNMFGRFPERRAVSGFVCRTDPSAFEGRATLLEIDLQMGLPNPVQLLLVVPAGVHSPVPCFLGLNFGGNHTVTSDPTVRMPVGFVPPKYGTAQGEADEEKRGERIPDWGVVESLAAGYAVATIYNGDVVPDHPTRSEKFLKNLCPAQSPGDATGALMAWAWGLSHVVDFLLTRPELDPGRIAVVGHSRNGKAALLATAFDERIAMVVSNQSGCCGAAPSRISPELAKPGPDGRPPVETLSAIQKMFPHWFCRNFREFVEAPERLPFEQDALVALCAPRPLLLSNATQDVWANPPGQFDMLKAADPVYRLFADSGLDASEMPTEGHLLDSRLGFFIRPGIHSVVSDDWAAWRSFASRWL